MSDLPLYVVLETKTTVTLGWTPPVGCRGYVFVANGKRSSTLDPTRSRVEFAKPGPYHVEALGTLAAGDYPPVAQPPTLGFDAPAWKVQTLLNQTSEGAHTAAWIKSYRRSLSNPGTDWDNNGVVEFADYPAEFVMVETKRFAAGYPGRITNFHLVGGDNAHGGVSPLSLDYHAGRSLDWPADVVPGVVLTCEAELDDHRRGHWQVLIDAEARGGEFTFVWRIGWRQNTSGYVDLEVHKNGTLFRTITRTGIKTAYAEQQPRVFLWLGAYESNGDQAATTLQTLDYRGKDLASALADKPVLGSIMHTSGPSGDSSATQSGTLKVAL